MVVFWGVEVKPGQTYVHESGLGRLRISQATLGNYYDASWTTLQCSVGDTSPVRLCALSSTAIMCRLDLEYDEKENVVLSVLGNCSVHLSGYYIHRHNADDGSFSKEPSDKATNQDTHAMDDGSPKYPMICDEHGNGSDGIIPNALPNKRISEKRTSNTPSSVEEVPSYLSNGMDRRMSKEILKSCQSHDIKHQENDIHHSAQENENRGDEVQHQSADPFLRIPDDGKMSIEDLEPGNANYGVASEGKMIHVKYVGKLVDGKAFDPSEGNDTFEFKLGDPNVIAGWNRGIEGMYVGGRRRLSIPPALGYGSSQDGPIPPNSWLFYDVELLGVLPHKKKRQASMDSH